MYTAKQILVVFITDQVKQQFQQSSIYVIWFGVLMTFLFLRVSNNNNSLIIA